MSVTACNDTNFDSEVLHSTLPVLVDFWAPWCGPCRALSPIVDEIANQYTGRLKVVKVNVGESPLSASKYRVSSIPNVTIIDGGELKVQLPGWRPKQALVDAVQPYLR
ncbi:MAG: thioredoxin [Planctomycetia bacterium]|nr:thioredoxin [Planctomycetia bacterium]